ncbi:poly(3-hydroxyalkanoate) depolymerase [Pseudonocardia sediminis]|uniref:Poly(3-hydroxyalkanoate) depolymerase n=1 Tax=Pseudonocardia sediminis TaxID=1397368 RepID=A0A4Q7V240_PSEST|nr:alpha/beta fold hydrolase [Pseudonocardia sediminis]RZT86639.1 poly(3-hydroxyalkanoate) depolymerase [Pseudonocardia sediminis]
MTARNALPGRAGTPGRDEVTRIFSVRGRRLSVTHRPGRRGRVPLLLCSGIGSGSVLFDPLLAELDPDRPVIRFDAPGVGASPTPRVPYRYATLAATVASVVGRLGYDRADVLGISWGGGLAQQMALQHPRLTRKLVLVATATGSVMVPAKPRTLATMLTPRRHRDPGFAVSVAGDLYGGTARTDPHGTVAALHPEGSGSTSQRGYLYQLFAISGWTSLPLLPLIRRPVLVISGDDDPLIPAVNATLMARLMPRAQLHLHPGGHLALLTDAAELAPVIETFLNGNGGTGTG